MLPRCGTSFLALDLPWRSPPASHACAASPPTSRARSSPTHPAAFGACIRFISPVVCSKAPPSVTKLHPHQSDSPACGGHVLSGGLACRRGRRKRLRSFPVTSIAARPISTSYASQPPAPRAPSGQEIRTSTQNPCAKASSRPFRCPQCRVRRGRTVPTPRHRRSPSGPCVSIVTSPPTCPSASIPATRTNSCRPL